MNPDTLTGTPIEGGYAIAPAFLYAPFVTSLPQQKVPANEVSDELKAFQKAQSLASAEYDALLASADPASEKKQILEAQKLMLLDEDVAQEVSDAIESGDNAAKAIADVYTSYIALFQAKKDDLFQARALDCVDLKNRLLRCLEGKAAPSLSSFKANVILIAHDLTPSEMASLDRLHVKGLVMEKGGETSHSAVLARSYGLPCLFGVDNALGRIQEGQAIGIDSLTGTLYLTPTPALENDWETREKAYLETKKRQAKYLAQAAASQDGARVQINLNLGDVSKESLQNAAYLDGVGLLRSEFLYMASDHLPSEDEQFSAYQKVLLAFAPKPVIIRTLDIGGDKKLPYFPLPKEENPQLGERALRLSLAHPELFKPQIRALLRAAAYGNLGIMFPMVETVEDFEKGKAIVESCASELHQEGVAFGPYRLGVMIEIPALALNANAIAPLCDFASIGSNDLTQYTLAVDRGNEKLKPYYQKYHPSVLRLIAMAEQAFEKAGKPISVCGELGGDPLGAPLLVGLGFRALSMSFSKVAAVKEILAHHSVKELSTLSQRCLSVGSEQEVRELLAPLLQGN